MRLNPRFLSSAAAVGLACVISAAAYYYKSRSAEINEVMVFCKLQLNAYDCFDKLISHVDAAKRSVNVCMPSIHNPAIQGRLVQLMREKSVKIRIIIDRNGYNDSTEFFLKELLDAGAEIKCRVNGSYNMQHKFCLIDDRVLMTGTLNWGDDRSCDHWNYVYITSKSQLVAPVKDEFDRMWRTYVDLDQALLIQPVSDDTDEESTEIESVELQEQNIPQDATIAFLRETQVTPELCIM